MTPRAKSSSACLAQALMSLLHNDKETILTAARGLKTPFAKVYMFFGDFQIPAS